MDDLSLLRRTVTALLTEIERKNELDGQNVELVCRTNINLC